MISEMCECVFKMNLQLCIINVTWCDIFCFQFLWWAYAQNESQCTNTFIQYLNAHGPLMQKLHKQWHTHAHAMGARWHTSTAINLLVNRVIVARHRPAVIFRPLYQLFTHGFHSFLTTTSPSLSLCFRRSFILLFNTLRFAITNRFLSFICKVDKWKHKQCYTFAIIYLYLSRIFSI